MIGIKKIVNFLNRQARWIKEILLYTSYLALIVSVDNFYARLLLVGLMGGSLSQSLKYYYCDDMKHKKYVRLLLFVLSIHWLTFAYIFESSIMGFIAVGILNAFLGFFMAIVPGTIYIGFMDDSQKNLFRTSLISATLLLLGWIVFYARLVDPTIATQFFMYEAGLYFFVSLSFFQLI